jgi:predicted exporter
MRSRFLPLLIWLAFVATALTIALRADYKADITAFLPKSPTADQRLLVDQLKDGAVSRMVLIGIDGRDPQQLANASKLIGQVLRADPQFTFIANGEAIGIEADGRFLTQHRYHIRDTGASWSSEALTQSLQAAKLSLAQSTGLFTKDLLPIDPTGEVMRSIEQLAEQNSTPQLNGVWMVPLTGSQAATHRVLLIGQTKAAGIDLDGQQVAVDAIQTAFAKANTNQSVTLQLSGPGVFSALSRDRIKRDATVFSTVATAMVVLLIAWVYRSPTVMALGLLPVATGVVTGIAAVALTFGSVHGITMGFGATMIGEAVDYAVYLFTMHGMKRNEGTDARSTMQRIWPTLRLGVVLSVIGFAALLLADFPGLQQLGVFSVAGLVAAVLTARWVLPPLVPNAFHIHAPPFAQGLTRVVATAPRYRMLASATLFGVLALMLAFAYGKQTQLFADNLTSINPISQAEQKLDEAMRSALGAPDVRFALVAQQSTLERALQTAEQGEALLQRLRDYKQLTGYQSPTQFLPSEAAQRSRLARLPDAAALAPRIAQAAQAAGFESSLFAELPAKLQAIKHGGQLITGDSLKGTNLAAQVDSLLAVKSGEVTAMLPIQGLTPQGELALRATLAMSQTDLPNLRLIDLKTESDNLYQTYRRQAVLFALLGVIAITAVLVVVRRSLARGLRLMLPLVLAVALTAALLIALGISINIFHIVAFLLVIGVGSNYALFFDEPEVNSDVQTVTVSLMVCSLSTMFGFGILAFSSMPVLQAIGGTVAIGALLSLILSAVFVQPLRTVLPTALRSKR